MVLRDVSPPALQDDTFPVCDDVIWYHMTSLILLSSIRHLGFHRPLRESEITRINGKLTKNDVKDIYSATFMKKVRNNVELYQKAQR